MSTTTTDWLVFQNAEQTAPGTVWSRVVRFNSQMVFDVSNGDTHSQNTVGPGEFSNSVRLWGVTLPSDIPEQAVLIGVEVRLANSVPLVRAVDETRMLMLGTSAVGANLALTGDIPANHTDRISGGPSNLWGTSLTIADIGPDFGFRYRAFNPSEKVDAEVRASRAAVRFTFEIPPTLVRVGGSPPDRLYLGGTQATSAYLGSDRVF